VKRLLFALTCLLSVPAFAQSVVVTAVVRISSNDAIATGGAQYHYANGSDGTVAISGFLSVYEDGYTVNDTPFNGWNGYWTGTTTIHGDYGLCYQAGISAHGVDTSTYTAYSGTACVPYPYEPPPYHHGYDICPLIIDLDGDGVPTTGLENTVAFFDTNRDGVREASGWTAAGERDAFLWMDLDGNGDVDPGELFGAGMPLPDGSGYARNGFQALRAYDLPAFGGNGDGVIDRRDAVWDSLRLWVDSNHDGLSQPHEFSAPGGEHIENFELPAAAVHRTGFNGNVLMFLGWFNVTLHEQGSQPHVEHRRLVDISFIPAAP
jgi:hypothetical protein